MRALPYIRAGGWCEGIVRRLSTEASASQLSRSVRQRLARLAQRTTETPTTASSEEAKRLANAWEKKSVLSYARSLAALSQRPTHVGTPKAEALRPEQAAEVYSSAVERLGGYGDLPVLEALLRAMDKDAITPSGRLMAHVIAALSAAGELEAALETYRTVNVRLAREERQQVVLLLLRHLLQAGGGRRSSEAFRACAAEVLQDPSAGLGLRCAVAAVARDRAVFNDVLEDLRHQYASTAVEELQLCLEAAVEMADRDATHQVLSLVTTAAASDVDALNTAYCTAIKAVGGDFALAKHRFDSLRIALEQAQPGLRPSELVCKALLESFCLWPLSTPRTTIRLFDDLAKLVGPSEALVEPIAQYWQERDFEESHAELIYATLYRAREAGVKIRAERIIPVRNRAFGLLPPLAVQGITVRIPPIASLLRTKEESEESKKMKFSAETESLDNRMLLLCAEELSFGAQRNRALLPRLVAEISSQRLKLSKEEFGLLSKIFVQVGAWRAYHALLGEMEGQGLRPGAEEFCEGIKAIQASDALLDGGLPLRLSSDAALSSALNGSEWEASRELLQAGPQRFEEHALDIVQALLRRPGVCYNTATADVERLLEFTSRLHLKLSGDAKQEVERLMGEAWTRENEWTPALEHSDQDKKRTFGMPSGLNWQSLLKENV